MFWSEVTGQHVPERRGERKLHPHMAGGNKEWRWEAIAIRGKHPFVIDGKQRRKEEPGQVTVE